MAKTLIFIIRIYQRTFANKVRVCVFYPTCSEYGISAISKYGAVKGSIATIKRILKCHPWQKNIVDPVK
ncbi:MAG: membrane protein insertion efficiency factor YidD [Patescibacteria group bacterium]